MVISKRKECMLLSLNAFITFCFMCVIYTQIPWHHRLTLTTETHRVINILSTNNSKVLIFFFILVHSLFIVRKEYNILKQVILV